MLPQPLILQLRHPLMPSSDITEKHYDVLQADNLWLMLCLSIYWAVDDFVRRVYLLVFLLSELLKICSALNNLF